MLWGISRGRGGQLGEEIHHVVVGVDYLRVTLTPKRVPRILLRAKASPHDAGMCRVDLSGRRALEREPHAMSFRLDPLGVELLDQLNLVPHEANAARKCRVEVVSGGIRHVDAQQAVETHRLLHVARDDPDRGKTRHNETLVPGDRTSTRE